MADDAPDHPLDRLHPVGGPLLGLGIGLAPAAVIGAGYPLLGAGIGCGLAVAGLVGARRVEVSVPVEEAPALPVIPGWSAGCGRVTLDVLRSSVKDKLVTPNGTRAPDSPRRVIPETKYRPALVAIQPGEYVIGSPPGESRRFAGDMPRRDIRLTRGYLIAETPVTQAQYEALMGLCPSPSRPVAADARRPVEWVSWNDAVAYCNDLSKSEGWMPAYAVDGDIVRWDRASDGYRLPTEVEWEVAARAGTTTETYGGNLDISGRNAPVLDAIAWHGGNSSFAHPGAVAAAEWAEGGRPHDRASPHPVKNKQPNAWGLYDMLGNVWEWTWDCWEAHPPMGGADPTNVDNSHWRVIRGGSLLVAARWSRAASRGWWWPTLRNWFLGFRPVRTSLGHCL